MALEMVLLSPTFGLFAFGFGLRIIISSDSSLSSFFFERLDLVLDRNFIGCVEFVFLFSLFSLLMIEYLLLIK